MKIINSLFCVLFASMFIGCSGDGLSSVSGNITIDGQPADNYTIEFEPTSLELAAGFGRTDGSGNFSMDTSRTIKGVKPGNYNVRILGPVEQAKINGDPAPKNDSPLPDKYHRKTELTAEVKNGSNELNFELSSSE